VKRVVAVLIGCVGLEIGTGRDAVPAIAAESLPPYAVSVLPNGRLAIEAQGADLASLLGEIAEVGDFEVMMNAAIDRPRVSTAIRDAGIEEAVRRVLRRRNYALVYGDDGRLARVIVLSPPDFQALEEWRARAVQEAEDRRRMERRRTEERRRTDQRRAKERVLQRVLQRALAQAR
jgi:hypothetical protein